MAKQKISAHSYRWFETEVRIRVFREKPNFIVKPVKSNQFNPAVSKLLISRAGFQTSYVSPAWFPNFIYSWLVYKLNISQAYLISLLLFWFVSACFVLSRNWALINRFSNNLFLHTWNHIILQFSFLIVVQLIMYIIPSLKAKLMI